MAASRKSGPMCNMNCIRWAARHLARAEVRGKRVLEVGSRDVNGTLRHVVELLEPAEYVGADIVAGPGVDFVCPAERLVERFGEESFDVVISTNALEHIRDWRGAVSNMKRVCRRGGILLVIAPARWPYHEYPGDYWRFRKEDMEAMFEDCEVLLLEEEEGRRALAYVEARKLEVFREKDLAEHRLYSVIVGERIRELEDGDFRRLHARKLALRCAMKKLRKGIRRAVREMLGKGESRGGGKGQ